MYVGGYIEPELDDFDDTYLVGDGISWKPGDEVEYEEDPIVIQEAVQHLPKASSIRPSEFTEFAFWMPTHNKDNPGGENGLGHDRFTFSGRRHMRTIYDTNADHILLMCGRQVEKSTCLGNLALCYMSLVPGFLTLYVSPSATQSKVFSNDRVKTPIETSPLLKRFTTHMLSQNILEKQFVNYSKITMRYAFLNADRARGIAAYLLELDEFQDILADNVPVIEQGLSHAPDQWRRFLYAGTPKSLDNNIEKHWSTLSTMNEWAVPCTCTGGEGGRYWNILCEKNIGRKGLICANCGALLDPMCDDAQWAAQVKMNPPKVIFEGYHISQLMVPWRKWHDILNDYANYPRAKFYNEVLGLSYDEGMRPLTTHHLESACNKSLSMSKVQQYRPMSYGQPVYAGIDWGTGEHCYTVICLGTYVDMKFRVFFWHRFIGEETEPDVQLKRIVELVNFFNVRLIGADYGGGFAMNHHLVRAFGQQRVHQFQYVARSAHKMKYDTKFGRWKASRTEVMSDIFNAIKRKQLEFPRWEEFREPFAQDMLNIFSEYNENLRMIQYKHVLDKPDDSFHALVYCMLASHLMRPRPDIFVPRQEVKGVPIATYKGPADQGSV